MDDVTQLLSNPTATRVAVVGATDTPGKWGGRAYRDLKRKGFKVSPVNPGAVTVDGDPSAASVADLDEAPDLVLFVVPPTVTLAILEECLTLGYTTVWIQPGAADEAVRAFVTDNGFNAVVDACILVETAA